VNDKSRGLLPFRVWQLFDLMVEAVRNDDPVEFIAAVGVMAHYVGDACQPLHISYKFNGDPDHLENGAPRGFGVHEAYESAMLNHHAPEILEKLNNLLGIASGQPGMHGLTDFAVTGHDAAVRVVDLMRTAFNTISPDAIIDTFVEEPDRMYERHGKQTIELLAQGARYLAMIWESAWRAGGGKLTSLAGAEPEALAHKYLDTTWAQSFTLDHIGTVLNGQPTSANNRDARSNTRPSRRRSIPNSPTRSRLPIRPKRKHAIKKKKS
jgi:hypothetical protein